MTIEPLTPYEKNLARARLICRQAYDKGMSLPRLKLRYHLSDSEARDICPEEFDDDEQHDAPEGLGGY